jgi:16S rRNA (uracil1498-N3)-methyltransferase
MTHRFNVGPEQINGGQVTFTDKQLHQIHNVLRLRRGERVRVFTDGATCDREVELAEKRRGQIVGERPLSPEPRTRLTVYPALLQRDKFEGVLQKLTEIGATTVIPVITSRGLVRESPDAARQTRWNVILQEAAEQCGRGSVPRLAPALPFAAAVVDAEGTRLVAYERERERELRDALRSRPRAVSLFVGPEGGFTSEEADCAAGAGAALITLGPRVLRTETAAPVLAALVLYELGDLSWK